MTTMNLESGQSAAQATAMWLESWLHEISEGSYHCYGGHETSSSKELTNKIAGDLALDNYSHFTVYARCHLEDTVDHQTDGVCPTRRAEVIVRPDEVYVIFDFGTSTATVWRRSAGNE